MAQPDDSCSTGEAVPALRVVVGEPDRVTRARLRGVLHMRNGIYVVGEARAARQLSDLVARRRPRVAVVTAALRQAEGVELALVAAARTRNRTRVVLVSEALDEELLGRALHGGVGGFVHRGSLLEEIVPAIRLVAAGQTFISSSMITRLRDRIAAVTIGVDHRLAALTPREAEVLALVATGLSNAGIAEKLGIGTGTVRSHLARILDKLSATNRAHAVGIAYESGLITGGSVHRRRKRP
ncbi:response regulator transcription factor [Sphaerimonospora thailandensis]|uniref:DNA-binding response regulator n=1 Tax=Sphaerimonospora thailandensis TaxID=795644 RepID=A0A8J3VXI4_9ACTN|nr:response regulator transcription factor [Sphaerimonospora thailandensis]GIH67936.1 DNA-binding response regulator [Sphaerimonospora thailandensis]